MADKRITDVDIIDSFSGDMSFFINQNNSIKQINKKNVIMPISNGGTGVTTLEEMKDMLGVHSGVIPIERGGTGATNARDALINLGAMSMISKTITLEVDNAWNNNQQTVSVDGVTANNVVIVSPRPTFDDYTVYTECGVHCSAQFDGGLIFTCDEVPSMIITVNVAIFDANNSTGGSTGESSGGGTSGGNSGSSGGTSTGIASVTQTTTSTEDGGVNIITVTLSDGTTSTFRVRNGSKGSPGSTPVKGTDYWTEEDKTEIKHYIDSYIDSELLGGAS